MKVLFDIFGYIGSTAILYGIYCLIRLINSNPEQKALWKKKCMITAGVVIVSIIGYEMTVPPEVVAKREAIRQEEQMAEQAKKAEEAKKEEEKKKIEEQKKLEAEEHRKAEEAQRKEEEERRQAQQREKQEQAKQDKQTKAKEELAEMEKKGKIIYSNLNDGTYNVVITERANLNNDAFAKLEGLVELAAHNEHERNAIRASYQCMKLVQTVKDSGLRVNRVTVNLRGEVVDANGYKSIDNIVICEIGGNKSFIRDDPYSFHNNSDRFWMINGL